MGPKLRRAADSATGCATKRAANSATGCATKQRWTKQRRAKQRRTKQRRTKRTKNTRQTACRSQGNTSTPPWAARRRSGEGSGGEDAAVRAP